MSELSKQVKIKERQAEYWMTVCHKAMDLFPEIWTDPYKKPEGEPDEILIRLLQELADRRKADAEHDALLDSLKDETDVYAAQKKCSTYDERDMGKVIPVNRCDPDKQVNEVLLNRARMFDTLCSQLIGSRLLTSNASDETAFIAIRDILAAHAQDKSYDARYGAKTAANASKEEGRAYETPSDKV